MSRRYHLKLYAPHSGQLPLHESKARFKVVCCGRRMGKTMGASNELCAFALKHNDVLCWWVAPVYRQAKIAYRLMKKALAGVVIRHSDSELRLELINGSVIECRSGDNPDNLRGEGIYMMVLEEAAMLPARLWFEVLRPMLSGTNGRAIFISTPRGRNWFYDMFVRGQDPEYPEWESFRFPTSKNPFIPRKEIEEARRDLPDAMFRQEYLAEFLENAAGVFGDFLKCVYGEYVEEEPDPTHMYIAGWDVAKYQDFSVLTVMDATTMRVVYWWRTNRTEYTFQLDHVEHIIKKYDAYLLMDCTGVGDPLLEQLHARDVNVEGYLFNNASKKALIENLALGFQHRFLSIPDIPVMVAELNQMEFKLSPSRLVQYSAPDGAHDDTVISLALAYFGAARPNIPLAGDQVEEPQTIKVPTVAEIEKYDPFKWADEHQG